jgi:hypothetical protein
MEILDAVGDFGIRPNTFWAWMDKGEIDQAAGRETEYSEMVQAITKAQTTWIRKETEYLGTLAHADYKSLRDHLDRTTKAWRERKSKPLVAEIDREEIYQRIKKAAGAEG